MEKKSINWDSELGRKIYNFNGFGQGTEDGTIEFYLGDKIVGNIDLVSFSPPEVRHMLAEMAGVEEYDNFIIRRSDKVINANDVIMQGLVTTMEDYNGPVGKCEGEKYKIYKHKTQCPTCGHNLYRMKWLDS